MKVVDETNTGVEVRPLAEGDLEEIRKIYVGIRKGMLGSKVEHALAALTYSYIHLLEEVEMGKKEGMEYMETMFDKIGRRNSN